MIVVGGKARYTAAGILRSSAVAEAVRKHSRRSVLLIADEHPLLCTTLPMIVEEAAAWAAEEARPLPLHQLHTCDPITGYC